MCIFCDTLIEEKEIGWNVRSTMADDNIYEMLDSDYENPNYEDLCSFKLCSYKHNDNIHVTVEYNQQLVNKNGTTIIHPFSESQHFNYCPMCGKQISKEIIEFKEYGGYGMYIEEEI